MTESLLQQDVLLVEHELVYVKRSMIYYHRRKGEAKEEGKRTVYDQHCLGP